MDDTGRNLHDMDAVGSTSRATGMARHLDEIEDMAHARPNMQNAPTDKAWKEELERKRGPFMSRLMHHERHARSSSLPPRGREATVVPRAGPTAHGTQNVFLETSQDGEAKIRDDTLVHDDESLVLMRIARTIIALGGDALDALPRPLKSFAREIAKDREFLLTLLGEQDDEVSVEEALFRLHNVDAQTVSGESSGTPASTDYVNNDWASDVDAQDTQNGEMAHHFNGHHEAQWNGHMNGLSSVPPNGRTYAQGNDTLHETEDGHHDAAEAAPRASQSSLPPRPSSPDATRKYAPHNGLQINTGDMHTETKAEASEEESPVREIVNSKGQLVKGRPKRKKSLVLGPPKRRKNAKKSEEPPKENVSEYPDLPEYTPSRAATNAARVLSSPVQPSAAFMSRYRQAPSMKEAARTSQATQQQHQQQQQPSRLCYPDASPWLKYMMGAAARGRGARHLARFQNFSSSWAVTSMSRTGAAPGALSRSGSPQMRPMMDMHDTRNNRFLTSSVNSFAAAVRQATAAKQIHRTRRRLAHDKWAETDFFYGEEYPGEYLGDMDGDDVNHGASSHTAHTSAAPYDDAPHHTTTQIMSPAPAFEALPPPLSPSDDAANDHERSVTTNDMPPLTPRPQTRPCDNNNHSPGMEKTSPAEIGSLPLPHTHPTDPMTSEDHKGAMPAATSATVHDSPPPPPAAPSPSKEEPHVDVLDPPAKTSPSTALNSPNFGATSRDLNLLGGSLAGAPHADSSAHHTPDLQAGTSSPLSQGSRKTRPLTLMSRSQYDAPSPSHKANPIGFKPDPYALPLSSTASPALTPQHNSPLIDTNPAPPMTNPYTNSNAAAVIAAALNSGAGTPTGHQRESSTSSSHLQQQQQLGYSQAAAAAQIPDLGMFDPASAAHLIYDPSQNGDYYSQINPAAASTVAVAAAAAAEALPEFLKLHKPSLPDNLAFDAQSSDPSSAKRFALDHPAAPDSKQRKRRSTVNHRTKPLVPPPDGDTPHNLGPLRPGQHPFSMTSDNQCRCEFKEPNGAICGVQFKRPYDLTRHMETIHGISPSGGQTKKQEWRCPECSNVFSRKDALIRHCRIRNHSLS